MPLKTTTLSLIHLSCCHGCFLKQFFHECSELLESKVPANPAAEHHGLDLWTLYSFGCVLTYLVPMWLLHLPRSQNHHERSRAVSENDMDDELKCVWKERERCHRDWWPCRFCSNMFYLYIHYTFQSHLVFWKRTKKTIMLKSYSKTNSWW